MLAVLGIACFVAVRDARTRTIPDASNAFLALVSLAFQLIRTRLAVLARTPWTALSSALEPPLACCIEAALVLAVLTAAERSLRRHGRFGMGGGDIKYIAAWTLLLGSWAAPAVAVAALAAALAAYCRHVRRFAFGPYLSCAFSAMLLLLASGAVPARVF